MSGIPSSAVFAQPLPVALAGGINLSSELYSSSGIAARRPGNMSQMFFTPTLSLGEQIHIPIRLSLSTQQFSYRQPFNQIGLSPNFWGWLTVHAGYFAAPISDLTFGDTQLLGGGVELRPGAFRFSFLYGRSQDALQPDSINGVRGEYRRTIVAGKVGYGQDDAFFIDFNFLRAVDDSTSLTNPPVDVAPKENVATSLSFGLPLFENILRLQGEVAVSATSDDIRSKELENVPGAVRALFTPRTSSQFDGAGSLTVGVFPEPSWSVRLNTRWVGPGYISLGYAQLPNDLLDVTVSPAVRFLDNRISVRASLGFRFNNLRSNHLATTRRTIGMLGVSAQPTPLFGLDLQYSNYGMRSNARNDTLRIDNISQLVTVSPRLTFEGLGGMNTTILSYSFQDFSDRNILTSQTNQNRVQAVMAIWVLSFPSTLGLTTSYAFISTRTPVVRTTIHTLSETGSYQLFDNAVTTSLTLGVNFINALANDHQLSGTVTVAYRPGKWGTLTLGIATNSYNTSDPTAVSYSELHTIFQYTHSF